MSPAIEAPSRAPWPARRSPVRTLAAGRRSVPVAGIEPLRPRLGSQRRLLIVALVTAIVVSIAARESLLRAAGRVLVIDEPIEPADVIVIAIAADGAGVLEAADLFHAGLASRVAVFADPPNAVDQEFLRRGLPYDDEAARSTTSLHALGVANVGTIPLGVVGGTEAEGRVLPAWCDAQQLAAIVVVTTTDHSRRLSRVLRRAMKGHTTKVTVRAARHSPFNPDRWWDDRDAVRIQIVELEKLVLDVIRHPLS